MTTENKYEVQRQMRQWGSIIGWATQAVFVAETDADAIEIFEGRDDWNYHDTMIVGDAMRMVRRQSDGPQKPEIIATRGTPVPSVASRKRRPR